MDDTGFHSAPSVFPQCKISWPPSIVNYPIMDSVNLLYLEDSLSD